MKMKQCVVSQHTSVHLKNCFTSIHLFLKEKSGPDSPKNPPEKLASPLQYNFDMKMYPNAILSGIKFKVFKICNTLADAGTAVTSTEASLSSINICIFLYFGSQGDWLAGILTCLAVVAR